MVLDMIGVAKQLPDSSSNPQNIFISDPKLTSRFNLAGDLKGIHLTDTGSLAFTSGNNNAKLRFKTTSGYSVGKINRDHGENAANGFMQDPKDFRNIEFSTYIYLKTALSNGFFRLLARGGEHFGVLNTESSAVGLDVGFDGRIRALKIRRYPDVSSFTDWYSGVGDIEGRSVGVKLIFYNVNDNKAVKYLVYFDVDNTNKWVKYFEITDNGTGQLGGMGAVANGDIGQPITWGGPLVFFNWFGVSDPDGVELKNISLREIDATSAGGSPSIPTTQQLMQQTPEGDLTPTQAIEGISGTSPATVNAWGVEHRYATGETWYSEGDYTLP